MRQFQTYQLSLDEWRGLKGAPIVLPTDPPITLLVENRRAISVSSGPAAPLAHSNGKPSIGLKCDECGAVENLHGKPFNKQGLSAHLYKKHGVWSHKRRKKARAA